MAWTLIVLLVVIIGLVLLLGMTTRSWTRRPAGSVRSGSADDPSPYPSSPPPPD